MRMKDTIFFILFGFLPGVGYQSIQDFWRADLAESSDIIIYLLGVAPNLLGVLSLAAGLLILARYIFSMISYAHLGLYTTLISLFSLLTWEFLQIWFPNGTFDVHDLVWTILGAFIFWIAARLWFQAEWLSEYENN